MDEQERARLTRLFQERYEEYKRKTLPLRIAYRNFLRAKRDRARAKLKEKELMIFEANQRHDFQTRNNPWFQAFRFRMEHEWI